MLPANLKLMSLGRGNRPCPSFFSCGPVLSLLSTNSRTQINKSIKYTKNYDQQINPTSIPNKYATQKLLNRKCHTENVDISDWSQTRIVISNQHFDMEWRLVCLNQITQLELHFVIFYPNTMKRNSFNISWQSWEWHFPGKNFSFKNFWQVNLHWRPPMTMIFRLGRSQPTRLGNNWFDWINTENQTLDQNTPTRKRTATTLILIFLC